MKSSRASRAKSGRRTAALIDPRRTAPAARAAILRVRNYQIRSVAVGVVGGLMFLVGLAQQWFWLGVMGALIFLAALVAVLLLGGIVFLIEQNYGLHD